jgi:hypothetical protein
MCQRLSVCQRFGPPPSAPQSAPFLAVFLADDQPFLAVYAVTGREIEGVSGGYYSDGQAVEPSAAALDDELAERLCMVTSALMHGRSDADADDDDDDDRPGGVAVTTQ